MDVKNCTFPFVIVMLSLQTFVINDCILNKSFKKIDGVTPNCIFWSTACTVCPAMSDYGRVSHHNYMVDTQVLNMSGHTK